MRARSCGELLRRAVGERLGDMLRLHDLVAREGRGRARHACHPRPPAPESGSRSTAWLSRSSASFVRVSSGAGQPRATGRDPLAHRRRRLGRPGGELLGTRTRHRHDQIEPVEKGTGELAPECGEALRA